jgi:hypothetical protein
MLMVELLIATLHDDSIEQLKSRDDIRHFLVLLLLRLPRIKGVEQFYFGVTLTHTS